MTPQALRTRQDLRRALLEPPTTLYKSSGEITAALEEARTIPPPPGTTASSLFHRSADATLEQSRMA